MMWYPIAGAGTSAAGTLVTVLAFALPYWIQLNKSVDVTGNDVTDVYIKFTHGLWRYCNLVTTSSEETERCGEIQTHSAMEQATECLLVLSIILSTNTVIQTVLYLSKIPLMSGQKASLYLAIVSAIISSLLQVSGLIVYVVDDHDLSVTDEILLEFSTSDLYVCFWLAAAGGVITAISIAFLVLTLTNKTDDEKDQASLMSSQSSVKSQDNFGYRTQFSDRPYDGSSSSSDYSGDEDDMRAPHPFIPKIPVRASSLSDIRVVKDVDAKRDDFESDDDDILKEGEYNDDDSNDDNDDDDSVGKMPVFIPDSDGVLKEYERIALSPETLTDIDDLSIHCDEDLDDFKNKFNVDLPDEEMKNIVEIPSDEETEETPNVDTTHDVSNIEKELADQENISLKIDLTEDRTDTPDVDIPSKKLYPAECRTDTPDVVTPPEKFYFTEGKTDIPALSMPEDNESEEDLDTESEDHDNQYQLTGQQLETPRIGKFGLPPVETARSLQSQISQSGKYLIDTGTQATIAEDDGLEDDFPLSFEKPIAHVMAPADTRELFAPVVLASKNKALFNLPPVLKEHKSHKKKKPIKPVFCDLDRTKTTYDKPVWQIPQYPEVPFYKRKRKHVTSTKVKKKKGVPSFKDTILHFKKDFKQKPAPPDDDSEC